MKKIESVPFWDNGEILNANYLSLRGDDNMRDECIFVYTLMYVNEDSDVRRKALYNGSVVMNGQDYDGYATNDYAYEFVASKLGLTLIS